MKILIDNGHGIDTPGKRSPDGFFREYAYTRFLAKQIQITLAELGYDARLLVPELEDISLPERCRRVNQICLESGSEPVILLSIHVNAAGNGQEWMNARGWSCYTTRGKTAADGLATSPGASVAAVWAASVFLFFSRQPTAPSISMRHSIRANSFLLTVSVSFLSICFAPLYLFVPAVAIRQNGKKLWQFFYEIVRAAALDGHLHRRRVPAKEPCPLLARQRQQELPPVGPGGGVVFQRRLPGLHRDGLEPRFCGQMLDEGETHQPLHAVRQVPVPVGELVVHVVEHGLVLDLGDALVHGHPLQLPVDEALGDVGVPGGVHRRIDEGLGLPARGLVHRLADELAVVFVAHVGQMPMLLRAQEAPRAADLQISHSQPISGPELGELPHRQQPLLGRLGQGPALGHGEVGVGDPVRPAHPAPELVELGKAQLVRVQDH